MATEVIIRNDANGKLTRVPYEAAQDATTKGIISPDEIVGVFKPRKNRKTVHKIGLLLPVSQNEFVQTPHNLVLGEVLRTLANELGGLIDVSQLTIEQAQRLLEKQGITLTLYQSHLDFLPTRRAQTNGKVNGNA